MKRVLDAAFPYIPVCVVCGVEKGVAAYLCPACADTMAGLAAGRADAQGFAAFAPYRYEGAPARIVQAYKYGGARWLHMFMAQAVMQAVCGAKARIDCVCHVPLHAKKRRKRGFDQAELLARALAALLDKPYVRALRRDRNTSSQTRLSPLQRRDNVNGAFSALEPVFGRVLLVDDVLTTGATASACARVLTDAGAAGVTVATFAQAGTQSGPRS